MAGSMAGTDDEGRREAVAVSMQLLAEMVDTVAVNTEPKHLPVPKRLEESVATLAAMHGLPRMIPNHYDRLGLRIQLSCECLTLLLFKLQQQMQ